MLKKICLTIALTLFLTGSALAADAHFVWSPNTETNLAGYKIYYGTVSREYVDHVDVGMGTMVVDKVYGEVTNLTQGQTYYFAATAYDSDGFESGYSQEVVWVAVDKLYPVAPELMLTILRRNPDGTVDLLDSQGVVIAVGVKLPISE